MRACIPLVLAVLCSLAWAGKSLSAGHGIAGRAGSCLKKQRIGELVEGRAMGQGRVSSVLNPQNSFGLSLSKGAGVVPGMDWTMWREL